MKEIFEELIANTKKKTWIQYLQDDMIDEKEQIIKGLDFEKELETKFREKMDSDEIDVKKIPSDLLEWADKELLSGNVAAVDGTEVFPIELISGFFCQVGVGGVSYTNTDPEINVQSITSHINGNTTASKYFSDLISGKKKITKIFF
jgi:hypothetical protein